MKLGIIGAMDTETAAIEVFLRSKAENVGKSYSIGQSSFWSCRYNGLDVVICTCGCGKVNSAIAATLLISNYGCTDVINIGCCGTAHPGLQSGDFVIPTFVTQYDCDTTELGEHRYVFQGMGGATMITTDSKLRGLLLAATTACHVDAYTRNSLAASGDTFIGNRKQQKYFGINKMKPEVIDMETAAIAVACSQLGSNFAALRQVTDSLNADSYTQNKLGVDGRLANIMIELLGILTKEDKGDSEDGTK